MRAVIAIFLFATASAAAPGPAPKLSQPYPCTREGCWFSYNNTQLRRCGQVDAAPRMPKDIWADQNAVQEYVEATLALYSIATGEAHFLSPSKCPSNWELRGTTKASWTSPRLMELPCRAKCNCHYPACPDVPDDPKLHHYCSLCGPKFNAPIDIQLLYPPGAPVTKSTGSSTVAAAGAAAPKCLANSKPCSSNNDCCSKVCESDAASKGIHYCQDAPPMSPRGGLLRGSARPVQLY